MNKNYRKGAAGALLDEYERAIIDLQRTLVDITDQELITVVDSTTSNPDCRSIQTILAHVVRAGFSYAGYIQRLKGIKVGFPDKLFRTSINEFQMDLTNAFEYTVKVFEGVQDAELEQYDNSKKMLTTWNQVYDIEQMMEHAIVHILRHRRQIEKFKMALRAKTTKA